MAAIDFTVLDGEQFEELCEDLFKAMGYDDPPPERSGRGPDGGRDLMVTEHRISGILGAPRRFRWLVECKNFAKSNKSVQPRDIGAITDKLALHNADGYLLVTTTIPSTSVEQTIRGIDDNERVPSEATYWARPRLTEELLKHRHVYEKYFGTPVTEVAVQSHWSKHNPFLELFPYQEAQAKYFFGRETDVRNVLEKIYRNNLVLLYGESGVGKTSLIQAGILPVLRSEGFRVVSVRMEPDLGARDLLNAVQSVVPHAPQSEGPIDSDESATFAEMFHKIAELLCKLEQRLVVILDQFEAIFQGPPEPHVDWGQTLSQASSLAQRYRSVAFLFSLKSEYLNDLGIWVREHQIPEIWRNSYPVEKLSASQAIEVLHKSPGTVNAEFSQEAIQTIVGDLQNLDGGRVYPPNLQIVTSKVFDAARAQTDPQTAKLAIGLEDYEAVGGTEGVLESFLDDKLAEFGPDRDLAHNVLLTLVSATGRRLSLSESELSERLLETTETLRSVIDRLVGNRLVKPTDQPGVYELVHDVLALKVLEATEEEQRKAKAAKEAFELAVTAWQTEQVLESSQRLDWFYQYRHNLDIGTSELLFLLLSETQSESRNRFGTVSIFSQPNIHDRRLRWIDLASPTVCIQVLDHILETCSSDALGRSLALELATHLCCASSFEVQRDLVVKLEETRKQPWGELYRQSYQASPIPTQASFSYLQDIVLDNVSSNTRQVIAHRILEHSRKTFPPILWGSRHPDERAIQDWVAQFPAHLLDDAVFRDTVFDYVKALRSSPLSFARRADFARTADWITVAKYKVELLKLLYERDPDRTVETLWDIVELGPRIGLADSEVLRLLRVYDPQRTIEAVVHTLSQERRFHSKLSTALLEAMEAPEADELLIKDLERYIQKYRRGGVGSSWRDLIRNTIQVVGRRRLEEAVPLLATIALRYEPENVKLDCVDALVSIGGKSVAEVFVKLLDDHFTKVRTRAAKHLLEMHQHREMIVSMIIEAIREQEVWGQPHQAKRRDAMKRKINTLRSLRARQAIEVLEQVVQNDSDESVRKSAIRALKTLRKVG